uniref:HSA domain-containing protein n=1 Tax=Petromyzon marinus TaxID=7757 RepID=S4R6P8_PETMA
DGKDDIAERAKQEADIQQRVAHLKKAGLWSLKKLTRVTEPPRPKTHRDYLLEEMQWLAGDFAQERRWKRALAKKLARTVVRFHEEQKQKEERAKKEELSKLRRIAANIAKEVKYFWTNIEKVVQFKQQSLAEEKRKKALDKQLNYIVDQTEKYSDWLSRGLNNSIATSHTGSLSSSPARTEAGPSMYSFEDGDFEPTDESDDEETIAQAEREEAASREARRREIELLRREGELSLEELLHSLPPEMLAEGDVDVDEDTEDDSVKEVYDDEFDAEDEDDEDVEETIEEQEGVEGTASYQQELDELAREGEMPLEDLYKMYA